MTQFRPPPLLRLSLLVLLLVPAGCIDSSTGPGEDRQLGATLHLPAGRAGVVLEIQPSMALDSLLVGPPHWAPGAYLVTRPLAGRVLVYGSDVLATQIRMRAFLADGHRARTVMIRVLETATPSGAIDQGESARISWGP